MRPIAPLQADTPRKAQAADLRTPPIVLPPEPAAVLPPPPSAVDIRPPILTTQTQTAAGRLPAQPGASWKPYQSPPLTSGQPSGQSPLTSGQPARPGGPSQSPSPDVLPPPVSPPQPHMAITPSQQSPPTDAQLLLLQQRVNVRDPVRPFQPGSLPNDAMRPRSTSSPKHPFVDSRPRSGSATTAALAAAAATAGAPSTTIASPASGGATVVQPMPSPESIHEDDEPSTSPQSRFFDSFVC